MQHETAQIYLCDGADAATCATALRQQLQAVPALARVQVEANLPGSWGAGTLTLDLCWHRPHDARAIDALLVATPGVARVERVAYQRIDGGSRSPGLAAGVWRTLLLRVRPGTPQARVAAFEQDLLRMPQYMSGIRNWQLARADGASAHGWTHVWQQEFAQLSDLQGEYLVHPYHWAWVDRWFDAEHPHCAVEAIAHVFCPLAHSWLTSASAPAALQQEYV